VSNFAFLGTKTDELDPATGRTLSKVAARLNLGHPFCAQYLGPNQEGLDMLLAYTACLAISLALGRGVGAKSNYIVQYMNDILRFSGGPKL
jgi:hypothetical protein